MIEINESEQSIVDKARYLLYKKAMCQVKGEYVGTIAAITPKIVNQSDKLNYDEIFIRDNIPVMIYLLLDGRPEIVRHFLNICLSLQSQHPQTLGIFPTSFKEERGHIVPDYGQRAIGRVISVDSTLWWPIMAHIYLQWTLDYDWIKLPQVQLGIERFLNLILVPQFRDVPTLFVPDGAFMIDRPLDVWGSPLEIQVLLYSALLSAAGLIDRKDDKKNLYNRALEKAKRLRKYLLKNYWVTTKTIQTIRQRPTEQYGERAVNEYNIQIETIPHWLQSWLGNKGGYLMGNIRTGRPDFRFFTLGNCLAALFDVLRPKQQESLFHLIYYQKSHLVAQMPLRICHPPLEQIDWRKQTGFDRKNLPWCYHNGGHWPCLLWYLAVAVLRLRSNCSPVLFGEMLSLLESSYQLLLTQLPEQKWSEYFDGPEGIWIGQQSRNYQTWTLTGFLLVHHFLRVNPDDARIVNLPLLHYL